MFFLIPKNVASERSIALMHTTIVGGKGRDRKRSRDGSKQSVLAGMRRTGEKDELSARCGDLTRDESI